MRVLIGDNEKSLIIEHETEFEEQFISQFMNKKLKAFVKTGMSASNIIGLKITIEDKNEV